MSRELFSRGEVEALLAAQRDEQARLWAEDRLSRFEAEQQVELDRERQQEEQALRRKFEIIEAERRRSFDALQAEIKRRSSILAQTEDQAEVARYRADKIAAVQEPDPANDHFGILPEMVDLIHGDTRSEIDTAIETMISKTRAVVQAVQEAQSS